MRCTSGLSPAIRPREVTNGGHWISHRVEQRSPALPPGCQPRTAQRTWCSDNRTGFPSGIANISSCRRMLSRDHRVPKSPDSDSVSSLSGEILCRGPEPGEPAKAALHEVWMSAIETSPLLVIDATRVVQRAALREIVSRNRTSRGSLYLHIAIMAGIEPTVPGTHWLPTACR